MTDPQKIFPSSLHLAAYLGDEASRAALGAAALAKFSLQSMLRGGDRHWRAAMKLLDRAASEDAACSVAELAFAAYGSNLDSNDAVNRLAKDAMEALRTWQKCRHSLDLSTRLKSTAEKFVLAVQVGGDYFDLSGFQTRAFGMVMGGCYSVIFAGENPRFVRWLGEAADYAHRLLKVDEAILVKEISAALMPSVRSKE
ncbi:MAG: hypothetical protein JNM43_01960 [Planctomycetaceae bacterium]|nr:hypothetical protein [Planctomycetaceae bacterium]